MVTHLSATRTCVLCFSLFLAAHCLPARTAELVGRVVDAVNAQTFAGALVQVRNSGQDARVGTTDGLGVFRMPGLMPGAYILDVKLPDGHDDARPWQSGFIEQTGQIEVANGRYVDAVGIVRRCEVRDAAVVKRARPRVPGIF